MMAQIFPVSLAITAVINFIPIIGIYSSRVLESLYQVEVVNADLELLLRHRALMFGLIGGLVFYSLVKSQLRLMAALMALISMLGFSFLTWQLNIHNDKLLNVALIDLSVSLILIFGLAFHGYQHFQLSSLKNLNKN